MNRKTMNTSMIRRSSALATTALALTVGLTACGQSAPAAKEAWNKAQDRVGTYKSLTISGKGKDKGKPVDLAVEGTTDDKKLSMKGTMNGGHVEILKLDNTMYMKADEAYLKSSGSGDGSINQSTIDKMKDTWIEMPSSTMSSQDKVLRDFVEQTRDDNRPGNKTLLSDKATVTEDKVNGKDAWKIVGEDKKTTVWVSADDKFDFLKARNYNTETKVSSSEELTEYTVSNPNKEFSTGAPQGAKSLMDLMLGK